jgi:modulator of FtsH protease
MGRASRFSKFKQETLENSVYTQVESSRIAFIKKVYTYFGLSLLVSFVGAIVSMKTSLGYTVYQNHFLFVALEFASLIGLFFLRKVEPINQILLFTFTFLFGLTLGPLLLSYQITGNFNVVIQAFALTTIAFGGLTAYAWTTKKDFSYLRGFLFVGIFLLIGAMIVNMFIQVSIMSTIISMFGVVLFSMFILYDTQNIMKRYSEDEYVMGAIDLFLDFANLFLFILSLLSRDR